MKICVINDHFSSGPGGQHRIQNLALGFSKLGHDVLYVSPYGISDNWSDLDISNISLHKPSALSRYLYPYFNDFIRIFRILSNLNKRFDLLVIGLPNTMSKAFNAIYGKIENIPVAFDFGGLWTSFFSKGGIYRSKEFHLKIVRPLVQFYEDLLALSSAILPNVVTVPTIGMTTLLEKFLRRKVHVIYHPIDTDFFNPKMVDSRKFLSLLPPIIRNKQIIMLGVKDDPRFVSIVKEIILNYGLKDVAFVLMGNLPKLKLASIQEDLNRFMLFTGPCFHKEVPMYISVSKIAVALSNPEIAHLYYFPDNISKIVEYLAMGKPIITNSLGAADYIQEGENGFICKSIDILIKRIVELLNNEDLVVRMGQNARKLACEKFDHRKVASRYLENCFMA